MPDFDAYPSLEAALNARYRGHDARSREVWRERHSYDNAADIPANASRVQLYRAKGNAAGLACRQAITHLIAGNVDQTVLEEIALLENLERLELEYPVLADDLSPLMRLSKLSFLSIDSPRKASEFTFLARMPTLRTLMISNAKHLCSLEWLANAHHLEVIGIEGGMDTKQTIDTLAPLAGLKGLKAFFGASMTVLDGDLMPFAACPALHYLGVARFAKKPAFDALREARPDIVCSWFRDSMWSTAGLRAG